MEYRRLGSSGLKVSEVGLGGNNFGWWADEPTSAAVISSALDAGINSSAVPCWASGTG
jgi:aryl-alcohol dehydrogenase-like predicted oxidoreductase